jgi:WD40 repeat protein
VVSFSPDGKYLSSGMVKIWDTGTGTAVRTLASHDIIVQSIALSIDGQQLASGSRDGLVRVGDVSHWALQWSAGWAKISVAARIEVLYATFSQCLK